MHKSIEILFLIFSGMDALKRKDLRNVHATFDHLVTFMAL